MSPSCRRPSRGHPTLLGSRRGPVRFSGSWSVRLAGEGFHANHVHPGRLVQLGLLRRACPSAMGGGGPAGWLTLGEPQAELGLDLPPIRLIEPKPGPAGPLPLDHVARHPCPSPRASG